MWPCIESNDQQADANRTLAIAAGEHHSIAAAVPGLQQLDRAGRVDGTMPDVALMRQMADYLRQFPTKLHHPKKEAFVFRLFRLRMTKHNAVLDELERQHVLENTLIEALSTALARHVDEVAEDVAAAVTAATQRLRGSISEHMSQEESTTCPAARRHLTKADWSVVQKAFSAHKTP